MDQGALEQFMHAVEQTPELWRSLDLRVLVIRIDGAWYAALSRCVLDGREANALPPAPHLPVTDELAVWHERLPISALRPLLEGVASGELRVGGTPALVRAPDDPYRNGPVIRPSSEAGLPFSRAQFAPASLRPDWDRARLAGHELVFTGPQGSLFLDRVAGGSLALDAALRGLDHPWDGVDAVARLGIGTRFRLESNHLAAFEAFAALGASFVREGCTLIDGSLRYELRASDAAVAARVAVGISAEDAARGHRSGTLRPTRRSWRANRTARPEDAGSRRCTAASRLEGVRRATLLLRVGPFVVDRLVVDEQGLAGGTHALAYAALDHDFKALRATLLPTSIAQAKTAKRDFEHAVARLFSLAGLRSDALGGYPGVQDAADVLATTPDGSLAFLVECTVGALNTREGKPARLYERADAVRRQLVGARAEVLPVMATVRHAEALAPSEREAAGRDRIAVLVRDDLEHLLEAATRGAPVPDIVALIRARVPVPGEQQARAMDFVRGRR